jgi:hypothetical protein
MTRIIARTALFAMLPLAAPTLAQTPPTPPAADAQADGNMTLAQFQAAQAQRMMVADTDGDGRISQAEWTAAVNARGGPGIHTTGGRSDAGAHGGYDPARAFARIDTNGDGFIDKAELDAASAQRFQRMDANGDGILTPEERAAHAGPHGRGGHGGREDGQPTPPSSPQP